MTDKTLDWDELTEDLQFQRRLWVGKAACAEHPTELFYDEEVKAKTVCRGCTVQDDCLEYALGLREEYGVWGGASEKDRKRLRRKVKLLFNECEDISLRECIHKIAVDYTGVK